MISYEIHASVAKIYNRQPLSPHVPIGPIWAALIPVPIVLTAKAAREYGFPILLHLKTSMIQHVQITLPILRTEKIFLG